MKNRPAEDVFSHFRGEYCADALHKKPEANRVAQRETCHGKHGNDEIHQHETTGIHDSFSLGLGGSGGGGGSAGVGAFDGEGGVVLGVDAVEDGFERAVS